jgi:serine phosphatase RsbU (regulator of sigma subunit)
MQIKAAITKKVYVHLIGIVAVTFTVIAGLIFYFKVENFTWVHLALVTGFVFVASLLVYVFDVVWPINQVLLQIKALLTGRRYKKIYSKRTDEIGIFAHFFNEVTDSLEKVTGELEKSKKLTGELVVAGQLQKELIPIKAPTIDGFDIAVKNRSAEELGGDNLDFIKVGHSTYFYIGDVTGHGIPAAIVMTMVNTLINAYAEIYDTALEVVVQTNRRLKSKIRSTMFMSMLMLKWNGMIKKMSFVGCGHEHILVYRAKTSVVDVLPSGGIALGMVADNSKIIKEKDLNLETDDVIILYTDGITEARNMKGEMFGLERLKALVMLYAGSNDALSIIQDIAKDFSTFVEEHVQDDDVTLVVVKKLPEGAEGKAMIDQKQARWSDETQKNAVSVVPD